MRWPTVVAYGGQHLVCDFSCQWVEAVCETGAKSFEKIFPGEPFAHVVFEFKIKKTAPKFGALPSHFYSLELLILPRRVDSYADIYLGALVRELQEPSMVIAHSLPAHLTNFLHT